MTTTQPSPFTPFQPRQLFPDLSIGECEVMATSVTNMVFKSELFYNKYYKDLPDAKQLQYASSYAKTHLELLGKRIDGKLDLKKLDPMLFTLQTQGVAHKDLSTIATFYGYAMKREGIIVTFEPL